jgi:hypothetical protein
MPPHLLLHIPDVKLDQMRGHLRVHMADLEQEGSLENRGRVVFLAGSLEDRAQEHLQQEQMQDNLLVHIPDLERGGCLEDREQEHLQQEQMRDNLLVHILEREDYLEDREQEGSLVRLEREGSLRYQGQVVLQGHLRVHLEVMKVEISTDRHLIDHQFQMRSFKQLWRHLRNLECTHQKIVKELFGRQMVIQTLQCISLIWVKSHQLMKWKRMILRKRSAKYLIALQQHLKILFRCANSKDKKVSARI